MSINENEIIRHAKQTFLALKNPFGSVEKVFPLAINSFDDKQNVITDESSVVYVGIKNHKAIPTTLLESLDNKSKSVSGVRYVLHTIDKCSMGGRAIDILLTNPITDRAMTGSSSGTAINVFLGINDLGIGTDGGGSVLGPAMSLNIYGFISSTIEQKNMLKWKKVSTDGISFTPSIGFIARDYETINSVIEDLWGQHLRECQEDLASRHSAADIKVCLSYANIKEFNVNVEKLASDDRIVIDDEYLPDLTADRKVLIDFLDKALKKYDVVISCEGPVDVNGFGDTIYGHFDDRTKACQKQSGKGFIRVANMVNATCICVPMISLGCAWVLMCSGTEKRVAKMLFCAQLLSSARDPLIERYFGNLDMYLDGGGYKC